MRLFFIRILLLTFSFLVGLVIAEGLARVLAPQWAPRTGEITKFWKFSPRYGWSHVPGTSGSFNSHGFESRVTINTKGFRGPEIEYSRSDDKKRVLVLGDSYAWGFGVNEDEMFTTLLAQSIPDLEVVNMAVSGYSTDQELLLYQDEGYKYQADLVLLLVAENDVKANTMPVVYVTYNKPLFHLENNKLVLHNHPVKKPSFVHYVASKVSRFYLANGLKRIIEGRRIGRRSPEKLKEESKSPRSVDTTSRKDSSERPEFPRRPADALMVRLLQEMQRSIMDKQPKARFLVVFGDLDVPYFRELCSHITELGMSCLVLGEDIDGSDASLHLPNDFHWNAAGHKRVAQLLAKAIERELDLSSVD